MGSSDRKPYLTATTLNQSFLDECFGNLTNELEMIAEIELPDASILYCSDRNKYVNNIFYKALINFPQITRTLGEWLSGTLEFSNITIEVNNADGTFNNYLQGGANFGFWVGNLVEIKLGLRDVSSTYITIFKGKITEVGGFARGVKSFTITARDDFDALNVSFPTYYFNSTDYPSIENDKEGLLIPLVYGDWTAQLTQLASIPAFVVNGNDANVYSGTRTNVKCRISINANTYLDNTKVYLKRGSDLYLFNSSDITAINADKNYLEVKQNTGATLIGEKLDTNYLFNTGDIFYVLVKGKDITTYDDNIIAQAKDIIKSYTSYTDSDFDANVSTYMDKSTPAQSNIAGIKSRIWIQEPQKVMDYVLSLLEQVRLEMFISIERKFKINSLHFEDWEDAPTFNIINTDVEKGTLSLNASEQYNFNRAQGAFSYEPIINENNKLTDIYKNSAAITATTKTISKKIVFPNLYIKADVEYQLIEILRLSSSYFELIQLNLSWRAILKELGNILKLNIDIGSVQLVNVPCMIREIKYNPKVFSMTVSLFSMQMFPYESWNPSYSGITSGQSATITKE